MGAPLPPVILAITAKNGELKSVLADSKAQVLAFGDSSKSNLTAASNIAGLALKGTALAAAGVGIASLKMAGDYQESVTQLETGAGETEANIGKVSKGMLDMAASVGTSAETLSGGMFLVESAGYHGADGLNVLKAAAQGAKLGNADLKTVADGVTTALTDYARPATDAATVTSQLVAAVAAGKTNMGDLSGSLSTVLPAASKAGIGLEQVLGAMSTMTGQGISAQQAAQNLSSTIGSLVNPTAVQTKAMAQMGLSSLDVAASIGKKGLTGTMDDLSQAIITHMGPNGLVLQSAFNQSKLAAQSAKTMLDQLPASLKATATEYMNGSITQKEWMKELKSQPATVANLGRQFATTVKQAQGFSDQLKSGKGDAATFNAMMAEMTGGQSGLNTALALTGNNMDTFKTNVSNIGSASTDAQGNVKNWEKVQKDFNFQIDQAKDYASSLGVKLGTALMPKVMELIAGTKSAVQWATQHQGAMKGLGIAAGVLVGGMVVLKTTTMAMNTVQGISNVLSGEAKAATMGQYLALGIQKGAQLAATAATNIGTAAQWAWNAAMDANPVMLLVLAIAALVAAFVILWNKSAAFRDFWIDAWHWIQHSVGVVIDWVKTNWPLLLGILTGPIGLAVVEIVKHRDSIVGFFRALPHMLGDALTDVGRFLSAPFRAGFNLISDLWNGTVGKMNFTLPSWVPGIGGKGFTMPQLPHLATGGDITRAGVAFVGENGPEPVFLPAGARVLPHGSTPTGQGGGNVYIDKFIANDQSPQQIAAALEFRMRTA